MVAEAPVSIAASLTVTPPPFPHHLTATMASKDGSTFFFTSESVNEGHPDKLADQVRPASPRLRAATAVSPADSKGVFFRRARLGWKSGAAEPPAGNGDDDARSAHPTSISNPL